MTLSSIKGGPIRWLWDQGKRIFERLRGDDVTTTVKPDPEIRDTFLEKERRAGHSEASNRELLNGQITVQRWVLDFRTRLKDVYRNEYLLGRGGRQNMTASDWGKLGAMLKKQYQYLNGFARDIQAGKVSEGQMARRAQMYFDSSRQAFERGKSSATGMPDLPAYPGDGQTQCLSNCQCTWDIEETNTEWRATWSLGAAEHCPDCVANAARWNPLVYQRT